MEYTGEYLKEISFPLGGIGTGSVGLSGNGSLVDWEIFNKPSKGSIMGYSHIAVRTVRDGEINARVLNGDLTKDYIGQYKRSETHTGYGYGPDEMRMCGFPHFKNVKFKGEFPIAELSFADENFPARITMTAYNPFIPRDAFNSSIPAAFFDITVENTQEEKTDCDVAFTVGNPYAESLNRAERKDGITAITMRSGGLSETDLNYGDLTVATDCDKAYTQTCWYRGKWKDGIVSFWNEFSGSKEIKERVYDTPGNDTCTLIAHIELAPHERKCVHFVLSWNNPNCCKYWATEESGHREKIWKNYYATVFENSISSAEYSLKNRAELFSRTLKFKKALHNSTLPEEVIDAASSSLSVLKSPTVLRLKDGSFYGWEGVSELAGSCEGTCQHVWNYAYAMCFLFPELERSIRKLEFDYCMDENGKIGFRLLLPLGHWIGGACVDGQMGEVLKCYREWKISGDNEWLKSNWCDIKKALEYAWSSENEHKWDLNKDGVLEGRQHHTLDMELYGPSSWLEGMYLAALKAAAEMAEFIGDTEKAAEYRDLFEKGYKWTKENLFNGRWFVQKVDISDKSITDEFGASDTYWNSETGEIKYQIAGGSSIDQMLAQWHANILGLGRIFDGEQTETALSAMLENNFKPSMRETVNPWRIFSLNDEAGSVICVYPEGTEKPKIPVPYCEETMTGFEYSFAGLLCSEGRIDDGLKVVKAVRDRFDGKKRNPWNEFECGSNYARCMASYALIPILSGFEFDMPNKHIGFNPYKTDGFKCIWSLEDAWGIFETAGSCARLKVYEGSIELRSFGLKFCNRCCGVKADGAAIDFKFDGEKVSFEPITVTDTLEFSI